MIAGSAIVIYCLQAAVFVADLYKPTSATVAMDDNDRRYETLLRAVNAVADEIHRNTIHLNPKARQKVNWKQEGF